MKKFVLDKCMNIIKKNKNYDKTKLAEIKYGLEGLYLMITKLIIITIIAIILNITKEYLLFMLIYTIMRAPSFGIHAKKKLDMPNIINNIIHRNTTYRNTYTTKYNFKNNNRNNINNRNTPILTRRHT